MASFREPSKLATRRSSDAPLDRPPFSMFVPQQTSGLSSSRSSRSSIRKLRSSLPEPTDGDRGGVPLGDGCFQVLLLAASMLAGITFLLHLVSFRVMTRVMDHWCRPPEAFANLTLTEWRDLALPVESDGSHSQCTRREILDAPGGKGVVVPCEAWDFDLERYGNNIISEWRLVCDRRWLIELAVLTYMTACVVFLPVAGLLADRVGRRVVMHVCLAALVISGFATSVANSYLLFVALRIVVSTSSNALCLIIFSVLYEVSTPASRDTYCFIAMAVSSVAVPVTTVILVPLHLRWEYFHLALMVPTCALAVIYCCVGDNSPAWLVDNGYFREAQAAALRAARINSVSVDECRAWFLNQERRIQQRASLCDRGLLSPVLSADVSGRLLLVSFVWAGISFSFNQVSLNDIVPLRKVFAASGIVAMVPMYFLAYAFTSRFSTRRSYVVTTLLFSVLCVALAGTIGITRLTLVSGLLVVFLRMLGNLAVILAFMISVQQCPVSVRCSGICGGFALGRLTGSLGEIVFRLAPRHRRDAVQFNEPTAAASSRLAPMYIYRSGDPASSRDRAIELWRALLMFVQDSEAPLVGDLLRSAHERHATST